MSLVNSLIPPTMPPKRKAAGAAAAKKGKKDAKKEEDVVEAAVAAPEAKTEEQEKQTSTVPSTSAPTRSSGRSTRRGKKTVEEKVLIEAAEIVQVPAEVEGKPDLKAEVEVEEQAIEEAQAAGEDAKKQAAIATADPVNEVPPPSIAAELEGRASIESATAAPASRGGAPDIIGVIEEREDEDYIPDDSEPAPNDAEELKRLAERPTNAVDTRSLPLSMAPRSQRAKGKQAEVQNSTPAQEDTMMEESSTSANASVEPSDMSDGAESSLQSRMQKMQALRKRMNDSFTANRKDVVAAQNDHRKALSESKRLERKRKQAEAMGEKLEAMETGEDLERKRNWEYSLADNEAWNKKQAKKERRVDVGFSTFDDSARRKYRRDMDNFKPDLKAYQTQKAAAMGYDLEEAEAAGELIPHASSSTGSQIVPGSDNALYRDANSFVYADHKPSDDAIDRVVGKLNLDLDKRAKRSRARVEDEGDITYINDRNKVFNKKLERYFNKVSLMQFALGRMVYRMLIYYLLSHSTPRRSNRTSSVEQLCSTLVIFQVFVYWKFPLCIAIPYVLFRLDNSKIGLLLQYSGPYSAHRLN